MIRLEEFSEDKLVMWDEHNPDDTALVYTPREDKNQRLYNSQ